MRPIFISILLLLFCGAEAQISIPSNLGLEDQSLQAAMPGIAREYMKSYRLTDSSTYLDDMIRFRLVAGQYQEAIKDLDQLIGYMHRLDSTVGPVVGIQFRIYAEAKLKQAAAGGTASSYVEPLLKKEYEGLTDFGKAMSGGYLVRDPALVRNSLDAALAPLKKKKSISNAEARLLLRTYNNWLVSDVVLETARGFLKREDDRNYMILDSVLVDVGNGAQVSAVVVKSRKTEGPQPVVLMYNIYADASDLSRAKLAAEKGFTGVVANTRGKHLSTQEIAPFENDAADSYGLIDWISKQPWCNGKIGMYGGSYLGFAQWSSVKKLHPALKTIVPQVAVGIGIDYPANNGVFMSYMLRWIHYVTNNKMTDYQEFTDAGKWNKLYNRYYTSGASFRSLDSLDKRPNAIFQRWLAHPTYDSYWQSMVPAGNEFASINIPILTTTGYFDDDQRGAFFYLQEHYRYNPSAKHYLLIGPYNHYGAQSAAVEQVEGYKIDSVANININETVFQWFDHILKDSAMPSRLKDKFNFQVTGSNEWRSAASVSDMSNDSMILYLDPAKRSGSYTLSENKPRSAATTRMTTDLRKKRIAEKEAPDILSSKFNAENGISFTSQPFQSDMIMNGSFSGQLSFTTNKKDVDVLVRLYEAMPDGKYMLLSSFLTRASLTKDRTTRTLLTPGKQETIPINNSYFMSRKISKGSRLVVVLAINNNPFWEVNYGSGKEVSTETVADAGAPVQVNWSNSSYLRIPLLK